MKRYINESGSLLVRGILRSGGCATSRLSEVEVVSALMRRVREGAFGEAAFGRALAAWQSDFLTLVVIELTPEVTRLACSLLGRHQLRASDAIQLASGLYFQNQLKEIVSFAAFDDSSMSPRALRD